MRLSEETIQNKLLTLKGWEFKKDQISKEFVKKDFSTAISFVVQAGIFAEKLDHHPDILIHSWNKVKISCSTHSEGGVTEKDFQLANQIQNIE